MEGKGKSTKKKKMKITDKKKMEKHMAYCSSIGNLLTLKINMYLYKQ